jgi:DNA-binding NarL/FixJ family response regulator
MSRPRLVLADDHRIFLEGLKQLLEPEFDLVRIVDDGRQLLDAMRELKPDVIVADISMPQLNGLEALEELKQANADVRVVFLTMHQNPIYARRALDAGALGYVVKQSAVRELVRAVRAAAAGHVFVSPAVAEEMQKQQLEEKGADLDPASRLTLRQREILRLLADGLSAKQIARVLDISQRTVESHKYSMMQVLGITSSAELIRFALQSGIHEL